MDRDRLQEALKLLDQHGVYTGVKDSYAVVVAAARAVLEATEIEDFDAMTWAVREHLEMWADVVEQRTSKMGDVRIVLAWVDQLRRELGFSDSGFSGGVSALLLIGDNE